MDAGIITHDYIRDVTRTLILVPSGCQEAVNESRRSRRGGLPGFKPQHNRGRQSVEGGKSGSVVESHRGGSNVKESDRMRSTGAEVMPNDSMKRPQGHRSLAPRPTHMGTRARDGESDGKRGLERNGAGSKGWGRRAIQN